jgi:hypothetical protein
MAWGLPRWHSILSREPSTGWGGWSKAENYSSVKTAVVENDKPPRRGLARSIISREEEQGRK